VLPEGFGQFADNRINKDAVGDGLFFDAGEDDRRTVKGVFRLVGDVAGLWCRVLRRLSLMGRGRLCLLRVGLSRVGLECPGCVCMCVASAGRGKESLGARGDWRIANAIPSSLGTVIAPCHCV
jgi:hypothetical protein